MDQSVLVSVCVMTYNSSAYILETLESIKDQTYPCIELIVSDDCSTDDTLEICRRWINANRSRFSRVQLLVSAKNTGIPANCNRAIRAAQGIWVKEIAGDDLLLPDCIENCLLVVCEHTQVLAGQIQTFYVDETGKKVNAEILPRKQDLCFFCLPSDKQHRYLLLNSFNFSPSVFIRRSVFDRCGYYDERYRYLEDLPYWLRLTAKGIRFEFLPRVTVLYRTCHNSMVFGRDRFFNERFIGCLFEFKKQEIYPEVSHWHVIFYQSEWIERVRYRVIVDLLGNKRTTFATGVYKILSACNLRSGYNHIRKYFSR